MLGILIGDGNFFKIKLKESIKDVLKDSNIFYSIGEMEDYIDHINNRIKEEYFNKECNFTKVLHRSVKEYFAFGNTGIGIFSNKKAKMGLSNSKLNFINYSVNNTAFMEGVDGNIDNIFMKYRWNAKKIVETFCIDETTGNLDEEKLSNFPAKITSAYNNASNTLTSFNVDYVIVPNMHRNPEAVDGILSARYIGLFIDFDDSFIYETEFFQEMPIKIIRDNINSNEIYGSGLACNIISEIELSNKISGDIVEQIENTVNPYLAMYENVIDDAKIVLDRNKPLILKASQNSPQTNPPIFPVIANGDISSVVQILLPQLQNNITSGLKSDVFLDFNSRSNMTATESMQRYNIRNKVLFANALDFQNLLNHIITYSYFILAREEAFSKSNNAIAFLNENSIEWFDIEYTSELSQISKTTEIQKSIFVKNNKKYIEEQKKKLKERKIYFISFADSRMKKSLKRIKKQAKEIQVFDKIKVLNEKDLDKDFIEKFKDKLVLGSRDFGYWVWKSYLILKTLKEMNKRIFYFILMSVVGQILLE
jgi:hypothetical protein